MAKHNDKLMMPGFHSGKGSKARGKPTGSGFAAMRERQRQREAEVAKPGRSRMRRIKGGLLSPARESLLVGRSTRVA